MDYISVMEMAPSEEDLGRLSELYTYLERTDYIALKIIENPDGADALRQKYADIIAERARVRLDIGAILEKYEKE